MGKHGDYGHIICNYVDEICNLMYKMSKTVYKMSVFMHDHCLTVCKFGSVAGEICRFMDII